MAEIVVRGGATARVPPDRATLRVVVDGDGSSREQAYEAAAGRAGAVDVVLEHHAAALSATATAGLVVQPTTRWHKGEAQRTGWRASRTTTVEVQDLEQVGLLVASLAGAGAAVDGPHWTLDPGNPFHREVRRAAAEDARQRAEDYAAALGLTLGAVAWVAEPGLRKGGGFDGGGEGMVMALASRSSMAPDEVIDVTPGELELRVAVEVGFTSSS